MFLATARSIQRGEIPAWQNRAPLIGNPVYAYYTLGVE
jgi:hypothetical protein